MDLSIEFVLGDYELSIHPFRWKLIPQKRWYERYNGELEFVKYSFLCFLFQIDDEKCSKTYPNWFKSKLNK